MYVIGMVGPFGSGCTYVANLIAEKRGYKVLSLSDELRELFKSEYPSEEPTRMRLQDFGDAVRNDKGSDYLARLVYEKIKKDEENNYVVDSIRNPAEISFFRENIAGFYLFGVFAEPDVRWERVKNVYKEDRRDFNADDNRDSDGKIKHGQRVTDSFSIADIIILNNKNIVPGNENERLFLTKLNNKIDLVERKEKFVPTTEETNMTIAYAASLRSLCLKRKVGAVIVDGDGNVFSSGYNEVPSANNTCKSEYGICYRDKLKSQFKSDLGGIISDGKERDSTYELFKGNFKILDYCRALHAEENAILNVARIGVPAALTTATLYTTTYPCNLCANKIAQVGIKKVVYFEPYPMEEAKKILKDKRVEQEPFEGVTYNGYFKLMEVMG